MDDESLHELLSFGRAYYKILVQCKILTLPPSLKNSRAPGRLMNIVNTIYIQQKCLNAS